MEIENTQCCAVSEISDLSYHDNAKDAMLAFCGEHVSNYGDYYYDERPPRSNSILPSAFYIFTGVVKYKGGEAAAHRHHYNYGKAFKAFILKNKLGAVTESQARPNRVNHPNHVVQVWVWSPNKIALNRWWKRNRPKEED